MELETHPSRLSANHRYRVAIRPSQAPRRVPIAGVPRNFATGHLLAMVTLFALLFSLLAYKEAGREWYVVGSLFIIAVILGQMFLFHGREPRRASCVAGACTMPLLVPVLVIAKEGPDLLGSGWANAVVTIVAAAVGTAVPAALVGVACGYLIGALCAGIFLVTERRWDAGRISEEGPVVAEVADEDEATGPSPPKPAGSGEWDPWTNT
jgi:hypothetical protein